MFEKEAENNKPPYAFCALDTKCELWKDGFQKGAEFGYNKAFVEADKNLKAVVADFNKTNEWHYVKNGDLPKENKKYWILTSSGEPKVDSWLSISWVYSYDVIAWKEIVLPKESE